ncbi:hypothetical protein CBM2586_A110092 [Cupriavidus phytorum]|uniref:Uncharacterized protein n=1 Tax=Cupriavidus taiwanensis TaxID=164546 RepID=A0A375C0L4_9BURK|nr:hypothetical protein CBM2586_A110092 [Cupriavidus taiwanensis]
MGESACNALYQLCSFRFGSRADVRDFSCEKESCKAVPERAHPNELTL